MVSYLLLPHASFTSSVTAFVPGELHLNIASLSDDVPIGPTEVEGESKNFQFLSGGVFSEPELVFCVALFFILIYLGLKNLLFLPNLLPFMLKFFEIISFHVSD